MAIEITSSQTMLQASRGGREPAAFDRAQKVVPAAKTATPQEAGVVSTPSPLIAEKVEAAKAEEQQQVPADSESLAKLVEMVNERPQIRDRSLQFSVHENTGKMLVRVYDSKTDELIRQFPPNELLLIAERIQETLAESPSGIMLQEKA